MKNLISWAAALALACLPSLATAQTGTSVQFPAGWAPSQSPCTKQANGTCVPVSETNPLPVTSASTPSPVQADPGANATKASAVQGVDGGKPVAVTGNVAAGAIDLGNPQKIGGYASLNAPTTVADGQRVNAWYTRVGAAVSANTGAALSSDGIGNNALAGVYTVNVDVRPLLTAGLVFNGTSWDRQRGDTTGAYVIGKGGSNIATGQVSVGTTATLITAARPGRQKLIVSKQGAVNCAYGGPTVTLTTGFIPDNGASPTAGVPFTWDTAAAVYGVCASTVTITDVEQY